MLEYARDVGSLPRNQMRVRRVLKGHANKVYSVNWSLDSSSLVTASQDGKMIIWDPMTADKEYAITLRSSWVMCSAYAPSRRMVASGGLDNSCSVYDLRKVDEAMAATRAGLPDIQPTRELIGHIGFIACARFLNDGEIITCSGDTTSNLWDIERAIPKQTFKGHTADVMNMALLADRNDPGAATTFVTVGCDATARVWDIRSGQCTRIYVGHDSDINAIDAFPSGVAFATGSDDHSCRMYDLRADREMIRFANPELNSCVTSVSFSKSGRALFVAYDDTNVIAWDTLKAEQSGVLAAHDQRVSSLAISPDGNALATASWDSMVKIWA